jgi:hypothetical protein
MRQYEAGCLLADIPRPHVQHYLKTHWKLAVVVWLITLCLPVFYHQPRGAVEGAWIFIGEVYGGFFVILLPAVFVVPLSGLRSLL